MEKDKPSASSQSTAEDVAVTSEVQRINQILEIENMDWSRQLKQAVSASFQNFFFF